MKRQIRSSARQLRYLPILGALLATCLLFHFLGQYGYGADEFQDLVNLIPRSANAVVLLNMDKVKSSPMGVKEGWNQKFDEAFESGLVMVPPNATRFVLCAQMDFEFKEPIWEAVVMDMDQEMTMEQITQMRGGTPDTIEGLPALLRPNDTYLVQLEPNRITVQGMMPEILFPGPANPRTAPAKILSRVAHCEIERADSSVCGTEGYRFEPCGVYFAFLGTLRRRKCLCHK